MDSFLAWMVYGFFLSIITSSFNEWMLHRFVMHRPVWKLVYPFKRHALTHHRVFKSDQTYHLIDEQDRHTIPMAWWNGPLLIAATQIPFLVVSWISGRWGLLCGTFLACAVYYAAYEYLHWCMHLPAERNIERSGVFFRLNGHHLLHHRYMNRNFNVVLPLADFFLGTLLLRSKVTFAQARGAAVPDVQPYSR
jgi:hypothetical protein